MSVSTPKDSLLAGTETNYPPFCMIDEDGNPEGFSVELFTAALEAMGQTPRFRTGLWNEVFTWLKNGEVAALPLVGRTPAREGIFDFTFSYLKLHGAIVVRQGNTTIRSLKDLEGRQVAVLKGDNAEEFLNRLDFPVEIRPLDTFETALLELSRGSHDAVVIQRLVALRLIQKNRLDNLRIISRPIEGFTQDFCFAVQEGDLDTLGLLNEGLSLVIADGTFERLYAKWFASPELPSDRPIIVGGDHGFPPYEFLDEEGRPAGYNVDLTRAIARETGIDVEIRLGPWPEIIADLKAGKIDALQGMFYSRQREREFDFSQPHTANHYVTVVRKGEGTPPDSLEELKGLEVLVQEEDIAHEYLISQQLQSSLFPVDTQEDALRNLADGNHDCALVSRTTAFYWIDKNGWTNLSVGQKPIIAPEYCYAVLENNKALLAQFSEGLQALEMTGEYQEIQNRWQGVYGGLNDGHLETTTVLKYAAIIVIPLLLVALTFFLWSWSLRRKVAQRAEELRRSHEFQEAMIACSPVALYSTDIEGNVLTWNASTEKMCGWTEEEIIGKSLPTVSPDIKDEFSKVREQVLAEGAFTGKELILHNREGELLHVSLSAAPLHDAKGNVIGIMGAMENISYRKKAEEALRQSERRLISAQRIARMGDLTWEVETGAMTWSDGLQDLLGYQKNEIADADWFNTVICHPDDLDRFEEWLNNAVYSGRKELIPLEFQVIRKNGNILHVRAQGLIERNQDGNITIFASLQDITAGKQARERITHLNALLRSIRDLNQLIVRERDPIRLIQEGCRLLAQNWSFTCSLIILTDSDGKPSAWAQSGIDPGFEKLETYLRNGNLPPCCLMIPEEDEAILVEDRKLFCPTCPANMLCPGEQALCLRMVNKGLAFGYLLVTLKPGTEIDQSETGLFQEMGEDLAYALNMIQMEKAREEAEQKKSSLENQLHQAQKMESIGRLAGGIAHDYNNMLSVIIGYAELAQGKIDQDNTISKDLDQILGAARRSAEITAQLLAFARRQPIHPRPLDLNTAIAGILKMLEKLIGENIMLTWLPGKDVVPVKMDPTQINQILVNLCVNSRDAINGPGEIIIKTTERFVDESDEDYRSYFKTGEYAFLSVSDNGCGMEKEQLEQVFEPFYTTKDAHHGTGLGLATVYGIVKQNNGFINAYSKPGEGTSFHIFFPINREEKLQEKPQESKPESITSQGETILVVEDEPEIISMIKQILTSLDYQVLSSTQPEQALDLAEEHPDKIDLLITDLIMPQMNGQELSQRLEEQNPRLKTLFMSGYTADVIANHGILDDGINFIQKPFTRTELTTKIREVLEMD